MTVVEHKATPVRRRPEVTEPMRVQVTLLAAALSEMGYPIAGQAIYFTNHHTRVDVHLAPRKILTLHGRWSRAPRDPRRASGTTTCRRRPALLALLAHHRLPAGRAAARACHPPDHRRRSRHSDSSSHNPGVTGVYRARTYRGQQERREAAFPIERVQGRRGARQGRPLERPHPGTAVAQPLHRVVHELGPRTGWARAAQGPNGGPRVLQHVASDDGRIDLARQFVSAKISNQATLLRRHGDAPTEVARLRELQRDVLAAPSLTDLMGIEGDAAARYFERFLTMIRPKVVSAETWRSRCGPGVPPSTRSTLRSTSATGCSLPTVCAPSSRADSTRMPGFCTAAAATSRRSRWTSSRSSGRQSPTRSWSTPSTTAICAPATSRPCSALPVSAIAVVGH